jgi:hypothetical protein
VRAADRTSLSGRVTADEANLDRFHSCIRKICVLVAARSKVYLSVATMILIVTLAVPAVGQVTFNGSIQGHERGSVKGTTQTTFGTVAGIVSNLGQLSITYDDTINLLTGVGTGSGVLLIGKNGDSIFTTISGKFTPRHRVLHLVSRALRKLTSLQVVRVDLREPPENLPWSAW